MRCHLRLFTYKLRVMLLKCRTEWIYGVVSVTTGKILNVLWSDEANFSEYAQLLHVIITT